MLDQALYYASIGLSVIPVHGIIDGVCTCGKATCSKPGKHPRIKWRVAHDKALTEAELKALWERLPKSNVGIVTGSISGIAVIDVDGQEGVESLKEIGLDIPEMPRTPTSMTGGGGYHLIYKMPKDSSLKNVVGLLKNVDIRAEGGMIIAPPSLHISGAKYAWVDGRSFEDIQPVDFDFSILVQEKKAKKTKKRSKSNWFEAYLNGVSDGERNASATRLAGRYFALGMTKVEVQFMLSAWNILNSPPSEPQEISRIVESIKEREDFNEPDALSLISSILKMDLRSVKRITGDEPQFVMKFASGTCTMSVAQLLSPLMFQQSIAEATKKIIKKLSAKTVPTHETLVQLVMDCSEDHDAGSEATNSGEMKMLLRDYVKEQDQAPNLSAEDEIPEEGPFITNGSTWIALDELVYRGGIKFGMRLTVKAAAQRMKSIGAERKKFGNRVMWGVKGDGQVQQGI